MFILKEQNVGDSGTATTTTATTTIITTRRYTQWNISEYCIYKYVYLFNLGLLCSMACIYKYI